MSNQTNINELKSSFNSMVDSMLSVIQDMHQQQKDEILALIKQNLTLKTITPEDIHQLVNSQEITKPHILKKYQIYNGSFIKHGKAFIFIPNNGIESYKALLKQFDKKNTNDYYKYHPIFHDINLLNTKSGLTPYKMEEIGGWYFDTGILKGWLFKKQFIDEMNIAVSN